MDAMEYKRYGEQMRRRTMDSRLAHLASLGCACSSAGVTTARGATAPAAGAENSLYLNVNTTTTGKIAARFAHVFGRYGFVGEVKDGRPVYR